MLIIQQIKELVGWLIKQMLLIGGVLILIALAPFIIAVLPQVLILQNPQGDFSGLATFFVFIVPIAVSMWMAWFANWSSKNMYRKSGGEMWVWRELHGGFLGTNIKSTIFMFLGGFGSFVSGLLFTFLFHKCVPYSLANAYRYSLWFALFPFAAFAPVLLLQVKRHYSGEHYDKVTGKFWNNYWSESARLKSPFFYYKNVEELREECRPQTEAEKAEVRNREAKHAVLAEKMAAPDTSEEELLNRIDGHIAQRHS
jgi:hypothetical protein